MKKKEYKKDERSFEKEKKRENVQANLKCK